MAAKAKAFNISATPEFRAKLEQLRQFASMPTYSCLIREMAKVYEVMLSSYLLDNGCRFYLGENLDLQVVSRAGKKI